MDMQKIYEKIKTPYKLGPAIKFDGYMADSPSVFKYKDKWCPTTVWTGKDITTSRL